MKRHHEYIIFFSIYILVLTILYSYKQHIEGFDDTTDFLKSNIALVVGFGTILLSIIVYIIYKYITKPSSNTD
jgi:uncharacterized membrane protein (DUF485 family)